MGMPREQASELRAVAPLVVLGAAGPELVGACTLVTNGVETVAFSSSELLRQAPVPLAICTKLDGSQTVPVTSWAMGRHGGIGIIELGPFTPTPDIAPLQIAAICASVDTRGAPSGLAIIKPTHGGFVRAVVSVHVDAIDGGGMSDDVITRLASPIDAADAEIDCDGATLFSWMPADPVLGRPSEVVAVALGCRYRAHTFKPRALPPVAELFGLEDLGHALPWSPQPAPEASNELGQIAGEIADDD